MSHVNNMHTWMTAEDFVEVERVLHRKGGDAAYKAEIRCIRRRQDQRRAEEKREHARVQIPLFALLAVLLLSSCATTQARVQFLTGTYATLTATCEASKVASDSDGDDADTAESIAALVGRVRGSPGRQVSEAYTEAEALVAALEAVP